MKKKSRIFGVLVACLMVPVCACVIYMNSGKSGVDDGAALRTAKEISEDSYVSFDNEAIALADTSDGSSSLRSEALRAFNLVNERRSAAGLAPLVWSNNLESTSAVRAEECSVSFSHTRPDGRAWYTVNSRIMSGENLAYGYYDADSAVNAWMNSPAHKENILWPDFTTVAISIYVANDGQYYWAQEFGY